MAIINCKCGKKFHDLSTFIVEYTNILEIKQKEKIISSKIINPKSDKELAYFCENCFQNIYNENILKHDGHKLIKIDKENIIISEEEFCKITSNLKEAENKVKNYLPEMRDMLLNDCTKKSEKVEELI